MSVTGADPDQLRTTATLFSRAADRLQGSLQSLHGAVSNAGSWRGPDAERFRVEWNSRSVYSLNAAVEALRSAAETLRHNADEQQTASQADGGGGPAPGSAPTSEVCYQRSPDGLRGMWNELQKIPSDSSGYRVQKVIGEDGQERYVVYIAGTDASKTQTMLSNVGAISGQLDREQFDALKRLIPKDAEVMLVGYSQGGIDAQNIAAADDFNVTQIVTYGSPVRNDLDIPAIHLQYSQDIVPYLSGFNPDLYSSAGNGANDNVEVFAAKPNLFTVFGLGEHVGGYGDLAEKWDDGADSSGDRRASDAAGHLKRFQGDLVDQVDIGATGRGAW